MGLGFVHDHPHAQRCVQSAVSFRHSVNAKHKCIALAILGGLLLFQCSMRTVDQSIRHLAVLFCIVGLKVSVTAARQHCCSKKSNDTEYSGESRDSFAVDFYVANVARAAIASSDNCEGSGFSVVAIGP